MAKRSCKKPVAYASLGTVARGGSACLLTLHDVRDLRTLARAVGSAILAIEGNGNGMSNLIQIEIERDRRCLLSSACRSGQNFVRAGWAGTNWQVAST